MNNTLKIVLATISLIIVVFISDLAGFGSAMYGGCFSSHVYVCYVKEIIPMLGGINIILYIIYLINRKNLFFWITITPLIITILGILILKFNY